MKTKSIAALFSLALALIMSSPAQTVDSLPIAGLFEPYGVAVDYRDGSVYITDGSNNQLLRYEPESATTSLITGISFSPEGVAIWDHPTLGRGLAVAVPTDFTIRFVGIDTPGVSILAGTPDVPGAGDGPGASALFRSPAGMAVGSDGTLYVADLSGNSIRAIGTDVARTVTTLSFTNAAGEAVRFNRPAAVAVAPGGALFVADNRNNSVKKFQGSLLVSEVGVTGPRGLLWLGGTSGLLIATDNHVIRRAFGSSGGALVYSGTLDTPGFADGTIPTALFNQPAGFALDGQGQVLVADLKNDSIRRINRPQATTPILTPTAGLYTNAVSVTASVPTPDKTPGSVFRFTTDGSEPTPLSGVLAGPLAINGGPTDLKVRAFNADFSASTLVSNRYEFAVSPLQFLAGGTDNLGARSNDVTVAVTTATVGRSLHFTIDGSDPTAGSPVWTDRLIQSNTVLRVIGLKAGYASTEIISNTFSFFVNKPVLRFSKVASANPIEVTVETFTEGARLYYTTDLTIPARTNLNRIEVTNRVPFMLTRSGPFKVLGERDGYTDTDAGDFAGENFVLKVADPVITSSRTNSTDVIPVTFTSETIGASFRYTINGAAPTKTTGTLYTGAFNMDQNGILKVIGYHDGPGYVFVDSEVVTREFGLTVAKPVISGVPTTSSADINVTAVSATPTATIRYWVTKADGTSTVTNEVASGTAFPINTAGTLSVVGVRNGFAESEVTTATVTLVVAKPAITVTPTASPALNRVTVGLATTTPAGILVYTLNGESPLTSATALIYTAPFVVDTNATLNVVATNATYFASEIVSKAIVIQADAPVMTPPGGFFQDGTTLSFSVARTAGTVTAGTESTIYYTLNGDEPTTNALKYTAPFKISAINFPSASLRLVKAKAIAAGVLDSATTSGELSATNKIGISREITFAGSGATIYMPVVVSLAQGVEVRSLQYRVQVWPKGGAPNLDASALNISSVLETSFIKLIGSLDGTTTNEAFSSQTDGAVKTNDLAVFFLGDSSNLRMREFGTINLLKIKIPGSAVVDAEYGVRVLEVSGTSDGQQARVIFGTGAESERTIKVKNIPYVVGDTSPGLWYNAGDFGDGDLDNSDVNNAFYASFNSLLPEADSDVFNAMDVFPLDFNGLDSAGDGQIRFLDWNIILRRALRLRNDNYTRYWTNGFDSPLSLSLTELTRNLSPLDEGEVSSAPPRWFRPVNVEAQIRQSAEPGEFVRVPLLLEVKANYTVRGFQFAATVESSDPTLTAPAVQFTRAVGVPSGLAATELAGQAGYAWPMDAVNFGAGIHSIGTLTFAVPANAKAGTTFRVRLTNVDGAENINTQYDMESIRGTVVVHGTLPPNPFGRLSDEWMRKFFGRIDNALAHAAEDADGDGISNADEFTAGTNPTELRFHRVTEWRDQTRSGLKLRFFAAVGKTYVVESSAALNGEWAVVASGVIGDGSLKEFLAENTPDRTKFYRVRVQTAQ